MASTGALAIVLAACGSSTAAPAATATVPADLSISSFNQSFSYMANLKSMTTAGSGPAGGILPHTTPSTRRVPFHPPSLMEAFYVAGFNTSPDNNANTAGGPPPEPPLAPPDTTHG